MKDNRRDFLIKLGSATLFGIGSAAALDQFLKNAVEASQTATEDSNPVRWGMFINMAKCADGCTDCVEACHTRHNVPKMENPKHEIKWIWKQKYANVFPSKNQEFAADKQAGKEILTICNHCAEPPCVRVCPTQATFKRKDGIVDMDFHRCIGCRFCMAGCPYGARSFNWLDPRQGLKSLDYNYPTREIGVVEYCNFCSAEIDQGRKPICVNTCKHEVLVFGNLNDPNSEIRQKLKKHITFTRKSELGTRPSVFYAFEDRND